MGISKLNRRAKIKNRVRGKISGTATRPRLTVFRSNREIYGQLVDDVNGVTITSVSSLKIKAEGNKIDQSVALGKKMAEVAQEKNISEVVFDRNGYLYHGRVKAFAEGAREGGLKF